jgi:NADH-quinone oxidoreductase subunit H
LMGKAMIIPKGSRTTGFLLAPLIGLAGMSLVSTIVWKVNIRPDESFMGDLIVVLYLLMLPSIALMLGGSSSSNPFGSIGVAREMKMLLAYELPFLIAITTAIVKVGTVLLGEMIQYQSLHGVLLQHPSCIIAALVCLFCMQAKMGYIPFDIAEAETEIIGGTLAEYSGVSLAIFKLTNAMLLFILPLFLMTLFLGGLQFHAVGVIMALVEYAVILLLLIVVKHVHPRLRIDQAVGLFWKYVTPLALCGLALALIGV